jgi:WD40 repeat protein
MSARLWDAATGRARGGLLTHQDVVWDAAFSPDGKVVATAGLDKVVRFWDLATGLEAGPRLDLREPVLSVAFSPDGNNLITSSADGRVTLWDRATGEPVGPSLIEQPGSIERPISGAVFSPDGKKVLLGVEKTLRLLDLPPLVPDDVEHVATWVEAITGLRLDTAGDVQVLDHAEWTKRREGVERRGGMPLKSEPSSP